MDTPQTANVHLETVEDDIGEVSESEKAWGDRAVGLGVGQYA
jgi:hypothetical protein